MTAISCIKVSHLCVPHYTDGIHYFLFQFSFYLLYILISEIPTGKSIKKHTTETETSEERFADDVKRETITVEKTALGTAHVIQKPQRNDSQIQSEFIENDSYKLCGKNSDEEESAPPTTDAFDCYLSQSSLSSLPHSDALDSNSSCASPSTIYSKTFASSSIEGQTLSMIQDNHFMPLFKECGSVEGVDAVPSEHDTNTLDPSSSFILPLDINNNITKTSLKGITDLCKRLNDEVSQLTVTYRQETSTVRLEDTRNGQTGHNNASYTPELKSSAAAQNGIENANSPQLNGKNVLKISKCSLVDCYICHSSSGNVPSSRDIQNTMTDPPSVKTPPQGNRDNSSLEGDVDFADSDCLSRSFMNTEEQFTEASFGKLDF
jgi:hypothetical protein